MKKIHLVISASILLAHTLHAEEGGDSATSIAAQQKEQLEYVIADINASAKTVVDTVVSEPQKAIDGGCLSNIQGIDLSVMSVDPTDIWGAVYSSIKDNLLSMACSAATDWANEQTAQLDLVLETDIGNIELGQGSRISDWQSVQRTDVELSNDEVAEKVTTETLGDLPAIPSATGTRRMESTRRTPGSNPKELEEAMEDSFNLKQIWGERDQ